MSIQRWFGLLGQVNADLKWMRSCLVVKLYVAAKRCSCLPDAGVDTCFKLHVFNSKLKSGKAWVLTAWDSP